MKNKIIRISALGLVSAFLTAVPVKAGDAVKVQDKLQTQDQVLDQDQLKTQDKLQVKEQLGLKTGKDAGIPAGDEKTALKGQENTRLMKGAENGKGELARERAQNAGGEKALKDQEKTGAGDGKEIKKQEKKQTKASAKEQRRSMNAERRANRSGNRKGTGKCK